MHNYLLTSSLGLEALVKKEVQKLGYDITKVNDKAVYFSAPLEAIARVNIWSRFGNILYYVLEEDDGVRNFDDYFDIIHKLPWKQYIPKDYEIVVKATSIKSELGAISSLQALAKKAIVKKIAGEGIVRENPNEGKIEIRILLEDNNLKVLLNTSGAGLHRRGYREMTGQAPLKENIAAAIVMLSGWKFREPFYDLFCGSGTIAIEALMIAKNMAPGLKREFAFEDWNWVPDGLLDAEKQRAKEKEFSGDYKIYASDIRKEVVESAKRSASFAGLAGQIEFSCQDYSQGIRKFPSSQPSPLKEKEQATNRQQNVALLSSQRRGDSEVRENKRVWIVSNPPYGLRLDEDDAEGIHTGLAEAYKEDNIMGGIITSDLEFERRGKTKFKKRKLYNGGELCYFYRKI